MLRSSAPKGVHRSAVLQSSYRSSVCFSLVLLPSRACAALGVSAVPIPAREQSGHCWLGVSGPHAACYQC